MRQALSHAEPSSWPINVYFKEASDKVSVPSYMEDCFPCSACLQGANCVERDRDLLM